MIYRHKFSLKLFKKKIPPPLVDPYGLLDGMMTTLCIFKVNHESKTITMYRYHTLAGFKSTPLIYIVWLGLHRP